MTEVVDGRKAWRNRKRAAGCCTQCGKPLDGSQTERCVRCKLVNNKRDYKKAWRARMRAEGRCNECGGKLDGPTTRCEKCRLANKIRQGLR